MFPSGNPSGIIKKVLAPDAEESAAEVVFYINLATGAVTTEQFHALERRLAACAEKFGWLVFFQGIFSVVLAVPAVLPADRPVLFGIFNYRFVA